jgi:hypothetical protein
MSASFAVFCKFDSSDMLTLSRGEEVDPSDDRDRLNIHKASDSILLKTYHFV